MTASSVRKLFGTDGIRAIAGQAPLDPTTIYSVGLALAHSLRKSVAEPRVLLGRDTRESGPWIASTLAAGLREAGAQVESAGVVTTPAVAFLARTHGFHAGVVISASHNPWADNGIKLFGADGFKLPDALELAMEDEILHHASQVEISDAQRLSCCRGQSVAPGRLHPVPDRLRSRPFALSLEDCGRLRQRRGGGHCAGALPAPRSRGRGNITLLNIAPDGRNINANCGALHPEHVAAEVKARGADLGVTFDGDADRCMLADSHGNVINGDAILLMAARDLKARGMLTGDMVVATTMSNMGLEAALKRSGIRMLRAPVGDRYVLEEMQKLNAALGGEQSGHILFPHLATTGDGLLTALVVLDLVARSGKSLDELTADLKVFPQVIVNVKVREKKPLDTIPAVVAAIRAAEEELKDTGRVGDSLQRNRGAGARDDRGRERRGDAAPCGSDCRGDPRGTRRVRRASFVSFRRATLRRSKAKGEECAIWLARFPRLRDVVRALHPHQVCPSARQRPSRCAKPSLRRGPHLPLSRLDNAGRETRSARAAAVTVRPAASTISVRIKLPGCGGFFIGIVVSPFCASDSLPGLHRGFRDSLLSGRNVKRRLAVTLRLQVPLRLPVSVCALHDGSASNSSGFSISSRNRSILRSLSAVAAATPLVSSSS